MRAQATCARATTKPCSSSAARLRPFLLAADLAFFRFEWRATWFGLGLGSGFGFGFGFGFASSGGRPRSPA